MTEQPEAGRIVVGVDGSPGSRAALAWAVRQAALTGATVAGWHVLRHPESLEWTVLPTNVGGARPCRSCSTGTRSGPRRNDHWPSSSANSV